MDAVHTFLRETERLLARWNVHLSMASRGQIGGSAGLMRAPDVSHVFLADDVARQLLPFLVLHEIAHLELDTLASVRASHPQVEREANAWALSRFEKHLAPELADALRASLDSGEDDLFEAIEDRYVLSEELQSWLTARVTGFLPT